MTDNTRSRVVTTVEKSMAVLVVPERSVVATSGSQGPEGAKGDTGATGPQGLPGVSGASYIHDQAVPSDTWSISHNLARFPSVTVVDSTGDEVEGDTKFIDANNIQLVFSAPFAGKAYIN